MSKFYVGQRVRIKWSNNWPELAGGEGEIIAASPDAGMQGDSEWVVSPNHWRTPYAPRKGMLGAKRFCPNSSQLEPLQPERNQTIAWSECIWRPEHMRAEA